MRVITVVEYCISKEHEEEPLKNFHKALNNNSNQSSTGDTGQETVRKLCQLHPNVPGTFEGPKNYTLNFPTGKHKHNLTWHDPGQVQSQISVAYQEEDQDQIYGI